jgi:hypothetical protein
MTKNQIKKLILITIIIIIILSSFRIFYVYSDAMKTFTYPLESVSIPELEKDVQKGSKDIRVLRTLGFYYYSKGLSELVSLESQKEVGIDKFILCKSDLVKSYQYYYQCMNLNPDNEWDRLRLADAAYYANRDINEIESILSPVRIKKDMSGRWAVSRYEYYKNYRFQVSNFYRRFEKKEK